MCDFSANLHWLCSCFHFIITILPLSLAHQITRLEIHHKNYYSWIWGTQVINKENEHNVFLYFSNHVCRCVWVCAGNAMKTPGRRNNKMFTCTYVRIMKLLVEDGKESACKAGDKGSNPWVRKIPCRREWQPTPLFLLGKSHEQRCLVGCSLSGSQRVRHDWMANTFTFISFKEHLKVRGK